MKNIKEGGALYYPSEANLINDERVMVLTDQLGLEGYGILHLLLGWLCTQPGYQASFKSALVLAKRMNSSEAKFEAVIKSYSLFVIEADRFSSPYLDALMKPLEDRKERLRSAAHQRWGNSKTAIKSHDDANALQMHCISNSNAMLIEENRIEENRIEENRINKKKTKENINIDPLFSSLWDKWLKYRNEIKKPYKSLQTVQQKYNQLLELSGGNPETAIKIVDQSIREGWAGFFLPKESISGPRSSTLRPAHEIYAELYGNK